MREPGQRSPQPIKLRTGRPKRLHARFPIPIQLELKQIPAADKPGLSGGVLRGKTENISTGGVCVRTKRPLKFEPSALRASPARDSHPYPFSGASAVEQETLRRKPISSWFAVCRLATLSALRPCCVGSFCHSV